MDWERLTGAIPVVLWIVFLILRKKKREASPERKPQVRREARGTARRQRETPGEFKRDYEPIEPS